MKCNCCNCAIRKVYKEEGWETATLPKHFQDKNKHCPICLER